MVSGARREQIMGRWLFVLGLLAILGASPAALSHSDGHGHAHTAKANKTRARLDKLRERIATVRDQISSQSKKRSRLSDTLQQAEKRLDKARNRLQAVDTAIDQARDEIQDLDATIDNQKEQLSGQLGSLRKQVRAAYENGKPSRLKLLLSNRSPNEIGRVLAYYHYFTKAQSEQIASLKKALADLAQNRRRVKNKREELNQKREKRAAVLAHLKKSRKSQHQALAALDKQLGSNKQDLASMQANAKQLKKLLSRLENQLNDNGSQSYGAFAKRRGHLSAPVKGKTIAAFHQRKSGGPMRWQGRWIAASNGTPVKAVAPGQVVYIGYLKRYGLIVIVAHGSRYYTLFGHASTVFARVGQSVAAGQKIAAAGKSGGYRQSGIFFQVRRGDKPLDPAGWLAQ
ncbi:peptidoglycan DD-metalloendopeptidase family protein [Salinisphaera sp. USBA-960]|nr:peptidoglycan DD-metalloendopeptidase family protein [Salifodinibacter halophilus]